MKIRSNFYLDTDHLDSLRQLAASEETTVSDLVREGIDRVISDRLNNPKPNRREVRASLVSFLERYAGAGPPRSLEEIDDLVTSVDSEKVEPDRIGA